jgi:hypothetical protein
MAASPGSRTVVARIVVPPVSGIAAVDALARLVLEARRLGLDLRLLHAPPDLLELVELAGLAGVLSLEGQRDAEQREQPLRVEEEGHLADAPAGGLDDL